ncbi:MAG: PEP-utilizing enzyme [Acidimicrobiales bacterium]
MATTDFSAPGLGSWSLDKVHTPDPVTPIMAATFGPNLTYGFAKTFAAYGLPVVTIHFADVNWYSYGSRQSLGDPNPDGTMPAFDLGEEFAKRAETAERAFAERIWRDELATWDNEVKPAAIAAHAALTRVDLPALSDCALSVHIDACVGHHEAMIRQHHTFNMAAILPVGDFMARARTWTGLATVELISLFEGYSPTSGVWSDEIADAASALGRSEMAQSIITSDDDAVKRLFAIRELVPEVGAWLDRVSFRLSDGFDVLNPTIGELPALALGKLRAATDLGGPPNLDHVAARTEAVRAKVPKDAQDEFDEALGEARLTYRLRDERGVYSDMSSAGLLRLALRELGRRLVDVGSIRLADHALFLTREEAVALAIGAARPTADELHKRVAAHEHAKTLDPPATLGPEPAPAADPSTLPPGMARGITAMGALLGPPPDAKPAGDPADNELRGIAAHPGVVEGRARLIRSTADLLEMEPGDIIVAVTTSEAFNSAIHLAGAIVTDQGGIASHPAIVAREVGIPAVVDTQVATTRIVDGATIRVDGARGLVTIIE